MKKDSGAVCRRCGACCFVHFAAYVTDEDIDRWRREGREDILDFLRKDELLWAGDRLVSSESGTSLQRCPFLRIEGSRCSCAIYETRPRTCREFHPGSSELCPLYRTPLRQRKLSSRGETPNHEPQKQQSGLPGDRQT